MRETPSQSVWQGERTGLTIVVTSIVVIVITTSLWFTYKLKIDEGHLEAQGPRLVKILAQLPYEQIVPSTNAQRLTSALQFATREANVAYLTVVDADGNKLQEYAAAGISAPDEFLSANPADWFGERQLSLVESGDRIWEFYAPLLKDGQFEGHLRLGYFTPSWAPDFAQIPTIASLALAIFLISPLFYFLLRREFAPLARINDKLEELESSQQSQLVIDGSGQWQEFSHQFNNFVEGMQGRVIELESDRADLETDVKVTAYQRIRVQSIIESLPDGIVTLDQTGVVSLVNSRVGQILGIGPDEILGKKPNEWMQDQNVAVYLSRLQSRKVGHGSTAAVRYAPEAFPNKLISVSSYPIRSVQDSVVLTETLVLFRDVTAEKLVREASGEFIAHVAHELKSPLNVLSMYAETLQGPDGDDPSYRVEATNVIRDEVERLGLLIGNILNISKIETGSIRIERQRVKLRDLIADTFASCTRSVRDESLQFELDLPREIGPVAIDKALMRIAINNLLTNAIKYSDPGGIVTLSVKETDATVRITVSDEGIGISPEDQQRIFEKFFRSDDGDVSERSGHGLGLSLAKEIVQLHQGTLTLESEFGSGSAFTIELNKETQMLKQVV